MILRYSLLRAYIAEHVQLLLIFSAHAFFLSVPAVETRSFSGAGQFSQGVAMDGARAVLASYHLIHGACFIHNRVPRALAA